MIKSPLGSRISRIDAADKVTGKTKFLTDMSVPGMVYAYPIYSSIPFGHITDINSAAAESLTGFIGFYTHKDIPGKNQVGVILPDQPLLVEKTVRFMGDVIGVVVADTHENARKAASLIDISYETLEPVFTIEDSKNSSGPLLHETNIACSHRVIKGDISKGFETSHHIIEASFTTPVQEHYYLEPQGCIVIPGEDQIYIIGSLQCPYYIQKAVAAITAYAMENIIVEQAPTGGAFGGKEDVPSEVCARTALAALMVKRPVKMVYDRKDDMQITSKRHPFQMHYKIGVSNSGEILAAEVRLEENAGAYATLSSVVSYRASIQGLGPYRIPNVKMESTSYYTNLPPNGAFRGFGSPQAAFGHERMMDIVANKLGMDPIEFRLINIIRSGDSTITGQELVTSVSAEETIVQARDAAYWTDIRSKSTPDSRYITGMGIAVTHYGNCLGAAGWHMDGSGASVRIREDGQIDVAFGLVEMGQGALTAVAQMTAEALGVDISRINVLPTRSDRLPDSGPSVASRNVVMTGRAIQDAVSKLTPPILKAASDMMDFPTGLLELKNDQIIDGQTGNSISFDDVLQYMFTHNIPTQSEGWWHVPPLKFDPQTGLGEAYFTYSYATHLAKVRVDTVTGLVFVDKIWAAHDVGKAINPAGIEGQVEGGIAQGIGWALTENFRYDQGKVITPGLTTYLLPTAGDIPEIKTIIIENPAPDGPWGAKGIGEPSIIPTAAAIANAVSHALGAPINDLPITPENVLNLIQRKAP
ncbi:MAG: xanthine dehydrogenase family protein [Candidatus Marinimicrobia bacterium]|nr:xanthine dehydrogenase family protein [Candidatus Neomarinimicrobiota bacterium]